MAGEGAILPRAALSTTVAGQTIRASGELDRSTVNGLSDAVAHVPSGDITLDLRDITFADSSALRLLIATHVQLDQRGRQLAMRLSEPLQHLLTLTGVDRYLRID